MPHCYPACPPSCDKSAPGGPAWAAWQPEWAAAWPDRGPPARACDGIWRSVGLILGIYAPLPSPPSRHLLGLVHGRVRRRRRARGWGESEKGFDLVPIRPHLAALCLSPHWPQAGWHGYGKGGREREGTAVENACPAAPEWQGLAAGRAVCPSCMACMRGARTGAWTAFRRGPVAVEARGAGGCKALL